ncbi:MAG TPA: YkgJ family cysteine cluster protein [Syntrophobacteria bacterium]|nr:YkgJ family cysteine cluster protein [Syntrophobacteria bacterium]
MSIRTETGEPRLQVITVSIETPDGQLPPATVRVPDAPMELSNLVPPMHQLCNGVVALALRREAQGGASLSCRAGCGVCCCQLVPLAAPEAFFLLEYVQSLPSDRRQTIAARFASIREAMERAGLIERIENLEATLEHRALAQDYWRLQVPCPFLEDNSCSIHPLRPFSCREYNVTSPPALCANPFDNPILKVRIPRSMTTAMARLAAELYEGPLALIPMSLALGWAEEHNRLRRRTWPGVWLFNRMMHHATGSDLDSKTA